MNSTLRTSLAKLFSIACSLLGIAGGIVTNPAHAQLCAPAWSYYLDPVGPDRHVRSLTVHGGLLYARGDWSTVAGAPGNNVAVFNGSNWSGNFATNWPYSGGPAGNTHLFSYRGRLYAPLGGGTASSNYTIGVILDGSRWVPWPATGLWHNSNVVLNINRCWRAGSYAGRLIAAGTFFHLPPGSTTSVRRLFAAFDGETWHQMDGGYGPDTLSSDRIESLVSYRGALYVGGLFARLRHDESGGTNATTPSANIARFNGSSWEALPNGGLNGRVYTMAVYQGDLYVGGDFTATADGSISLLRIARLRNGMWERVGGGLAGSRPRSMTVANDGRGRALFIGATSGEANNVPPPTAHTVPVAGVVRWNGLRYSALGDGITGGVAVYAMARYDPGTGEALFVGADSLRNLDDLSFFGRTARWGPAPMVDSDGDAIFDLWETNGIDGDCDGIIDLPLHTMGADPLRKDIFVEIDTMVGRVPFPEAISNVVAAFAAVPNSYLNNPNGSNGINLHLVLSDTNIPFANAWTNQVDTDDDGKVEWFKEFDDAKDRFFGSTDERSETNRWPAIRAARERVFRYCIFANRIFATNDSTSGIAELPGNDFIVSLGGWSTPGGTPNQQAGTFMHELGHTLNLKHGGVDHVNCKPNYVSVMNYYWQTRHQANANWWRLDYSREALTSLNETALNEQTGVGTANSLYQAFRTYYGAAVFTTNAGVVNARYTNLTLRLNGSPVDWDHNGVTNTAALVMGDLNVLPECWYLSAGELLTGHQDWSALQYRIYGHPNYDEGVHSETTDDDEITLEISQALDALPPIALCPVTIQVVGADTVLTWNCAGVLASAPTVTGPWTRHETATSPFQMPFASGARFFRLED